MEKKVYGHFDDAQREYVITDPLATMECLWTMAVAISISKMATLSGTQDGSLARHRSTAMNVVMA